MYFWLTIDSTLRKFSSKIAILFLISILYSACSSTKKVEDDEQLLTKNVLIVNDTVIKNERIPIGITYKRELSDRLKK